MVQMVPLLGFAPDLPPDTPGVVVDCSDLVPFNDGFAAVRQLVNQSPALPADCKGAFSIPVPVVSTLKTIIAGTRTKLYVLNRAFAGSWEEIGRLAGDYTLTTLTDDRWVFCAFGQMVIAANRRDVLQVSTGPFGGNRFADIAGAPRARIVFVAGDFVLALDDQTVGENDRWRCSGIFDPLTWAPSVSTQSNTGRLTQTFGGFTAGLALGNLAIAYKEKSVFKGVYVGGAAVWQWELVTDQVGAVGPHAVCVADGVHYFLSRNGLYSFDGVSVRQVGDAAAKWITGRLTSNLAASHVVYESANKRLWIVFSYDVLIYDLRSGRFGKASPAAGGALFDGACLVDENVQVAGVSGSSVFHILRTDTLQAYSGTGSVQASFTTGVFGDAQRSKNCRGLHALFVGPLTPSSQCVLRSYTGEPAQGVSATATSTELRNGRYDVRGSGNWLDVQITFNSAVLLPSSGSAFPADRNRETTIRAIGFDVSTGGKR